MSANYPISLDDTVTLPNPSATDKQNSPSHSNLHSTENAAIKAVESKVGIGDTTPAANKILLGTGAGTSAWQQLTSAELRGVLSDETGTGAAVFATTPTIITPKIDTINEETSANGVTVDGVILKDGGVTTSNPILVDTISEKTSANGVAVDGVILKDGGITTSNPILVDTISEKTSGNGVTIDSFAIKDGLPKNWNGWITPDETWTYASTSTFTVPGDQTNKYTKSSRLKFTQTTVKYSSVVSSVYSSPNTTVTIDTSWGYTIANAAITDNYYSYSNAPSGFPIDSAWHEVGAASEPAFTNSWVNFNVAYASCAFMKDSFGFVHLKGMAKSGSVNASIFTLPAGYRPALNEYYAVVSNDLFAEMQVASDGTVRMPAGGSNVFTSINGITFRAA